MAGFLEDLLKNTKEFTQQDMLRRTGQAGDPAKAAIQDRMNEGRMVSSAIPDVLHPLALPLFAGAAGGYEGAKALGAGPYLPGPLKTDENTSPASLENIFAALKGFTDESELSKILNSVFGGQ